MIAWPGSTLAELHAPIPPVGSVELSTLPFSSTATSPAPPPSPTAFVEAARLERDWYADVAGGQSSDDRPVWVRRSWRALDRAAAIDG